MGFLPLSVEAFLQTDNSKSIDPNNTKFIKQGSKTLLRYGVENSEKRSFIACLAELYTRVHKLPKIPTINEMCEIIARAITIDFFLKYHNGSLPAIFKPEIYDQDIDHRKYTDSKFMTTINRSIPAQEDFFYSTIGAYENFISYILNPDSKIDHTYLWDMVCIPNENLFINGYNLAILKIREVDMTDDIELICPTNAYSSTLYDRKKETFILIQHDVFYEPVYFIEYTIYNEINITHTFKESNPTVKSVHHILTIIRNTIQKYCSPQDSLPSTYTFKRNKFADEIRLILKDNGFIIEKQVINYQGKTIAFVVSGNKITSTYIPCAPSVKIDDIDTIYMDEPSLWKSYEKTRDSLLVVKKKTMDKIICEPIFKVMEGPLIIGILTETNQFLMIDPVIPNIKDGIRTIKDKNYIIADNADKVLSMSSNKHDIKRVKTIQRITLETQFYKIFRSLIRLLLHQIKFKQQKIELIELIENNPRILYKDKLSKVVDILKTISKDQIDFTLVIDDLALDSIETCFIPQTKKTIKKDPRSCILQENGVVILPKTHLVSGVSNKTLYYNRVADELIRYKRIQQFLLYPKTYLSITDVEYQINENEIIMLESLLTTDYFKNLEPYYIPNKSKITYEIANPIKSQRYTNIITGQIQDELEKDEIEEIEIDELKIECIKDDKHKIIGNVSDSLWKKIFPNTAREMVLQKSPKCSFYPIIYVYEKVKGIQITIENIKMHLLEQYNYFIKLGFENKILSILRKQGKKTFIDDIHNKKYSLQDCVVTQAYFMTNLDLWICANSLELPIVLFTPVNPNDSKPIPKLRSFEGLDNWIRLYTPKTVSPFYFVRSSIEPENPDDFLPQYNIVTPELRIQIPNEKDINHIHIEDYLRYGK